MRRLKRCHCLQQSFRSQHSQLPKRPLHPAGQWKRTDVPHFTASNSSIRNIFRVLFIYQTAFPPAPSLPSVPSLPSRFSSRAQCWSDPLGRLLSAGRLLTPPSPKWLAARGLPASMLISRQTSPAVLTFRVCDQAGGEARFKHEQTNATAGRRTALARPTRFALGSVLPQEEAVGRDLETFTLASCWCCQCTAPLLCLVLAGPECCWHPGTSHHRPLVRIVFRFPECQMLNSLQHLCVGPQLSVYRENALSGPSS